MRECCRQSQAEMVSNSRVKIHVTRGPPFGVALYGFGRCGISDISFVSLLSRSVSQSFSGYKHGGMVSFLKLASLCRNPEWRRTISKIEISTLVAKASRVLLLPTFKKPMGLLDLPAAFLQGRSCRVSHCLLCSNGGCQVS